MPVYKAPLRDIRFVLYELFDAQSLVRLPGYEEFGRDLVDPVLEEAARLFEEVLFPLNRSGDEEGCVLENGVVRTPAGFQDAYRQYREAGWTGLVAAPEHGGQGAPHLLDMMVGEMMCSANLSFGMYPGLSHGAYNAISVWGTDAQKATYLPKIVDGTWSGTMCLTEPHCGTDLGLLRTAAVPRDDGSYAITGTKIFISAGEHDLTDNIIHLVLARLPGAPKGVRGISLFLVPKVLPDASGRPGARNALACGALEHKMGIKASATCVMNFDGATGWLIGEANKGMRAMFTMMNTARLAVGMQGLGIAEVARQNAVAWARDRLQGRALSGAKAPGKAADPLIVHPDIRRMLLTQRALVEGCRALAAWAGIEQDMLTHHPDAARRQEADDFVQLITPIVKALLTDVGDQVANITVQVHGGHGYIRETGVEQYVRDCRITQIYEGTNGIQALDLVGRKMGLHAGRPLRRFFHPVAAYIEARGEDEALAPFIGPLAKAFVRLQQATGQIAAKGLVKPDEAGAAATEYLRLFGLVALAYLWARMAEVALPKAGGEGDADGFYAAKVTTARFYMERILPETGALFAQIMAGAGTMMAFDDAAW